MKSSHFTFEKRPLLCLVIIVFWTVLATATDSNWTIKHEAGRCAMRGQCGKVDVFFGKELPCPDNRIAKQPEDDVRKKLMKICGDKWKKGPICCDEDQVRISMTKHPTMC